MELVKAYYKKAKMIRNENFISLFLDNQDFLDFCIKEICKRKNIKVNCDNLNITYNELSIGKLNEKFKQADIITSNEDNVINIEANNVVNKTTRMKNTSYLLKMYSEDTEKGKNYNTNKKFIQINFDNGNNKKFGLLSRASLLTMERHPVIDNLYFLYLNIAKCYKKFYNLVNEGKENKIANYIRIGALFYSNNPDEVDIILGNMLDINMKKRVINKIKEMYRMNSDYSLTEETKKNYADFLYYGWKREFTEEGIKKGRKEGKKEGLKEGKKEGIIQGIQQKATEMIKSMLKNDIDIAKIAKVSDKSIEEIKEIEKSMK